MQRLVYSPKIYAYLKTDATRNIGPDAYIDISDFISSGQINRVTNAASQFTLTVRNPYRIFTQPDPATIGEWVSKIDVLQSHVFAQIRAAPGEPVFHPMDTITIWGSRFNNRPIQLFTGYLDTAPYLQLYPGAITLSGTCTLKRVINTYWDPGLQRVISWLQAYGWFPDPTSGTVSNLPAVGSSRTLQQTKGQLNDGSIAKLVYGLLHDIGDWADDEILIEELPSGIIPAVTAIYKTIQADNSLAEQELQQFLMSAIGTSSYGSGSGGGGGGNGTFTVSSAALNAVTDPRIKNNPNFRTFISAMASTTGLDPLVLAAWVLQEGGSATGGQYNYLNIGNTNTQFYGTGDQIWTDPGTAGHYSGLWLEGKYSVPGFGTASSGIQGIAKTAGQSPQAQISAIQNSGWATSGEPLLPGLYQQLAGEAGAAANNTATTSSGAGSTTGGGTTVSGGKSQTPKGSSSGKVNSNGVINPIPGFTNLTFDKGIDGSAPTGSAILAPAACTLVAVDPNFYQGQPQLLFKFDQTIPNASSQYWYISEQIVPVTTALGTRYNQGDTVATFAASGTGIEIGWGDPNTGDYRQAPVEAHYGTVHTGYGWNFYNYFSVGTGTPAAATGGGTAGGGAGGSASGSGSPGSSGNIMGDASAAAFAVSISLPGIADEAEAAILTGQKSMMNDVSLMPFTQQVVAASMRTFQTLPDGTFFAFFPDYFGEFALAAGLGGGPYWMIDDIEIIDGKIQLSDQALATHVYVIGQTPGSFGQYGGADAQLINEIMSAGVMTIFDAFESGFVNLGISGLNTQLKGKVNAINFLKRYGARPYINQDASFVQNTMFEAFMAFQTFQLMWARQFQTNFSFTFMPELYPGGRCGFSDHGFQCYIDAVTHNFDYQQGFTTDATLEAPSVLPGLTDNVGISKGLVRGDLAFTVTAPPPPNKPGAKKTK